MSGDFLVTWGWVLWLALILVLVIIEVFTLDFTFLMIAIGSIAGLVASLLQVPWWAQIVLAGIAAIVLLFLVRPPLLRRFREGGDPTPSNTAALVGISAVVVQDFRGGTGQVKLRNGETWTARLATEISADLVEGESVVVTEIQGATALVSPTPPTET